ncbi:spore germination protein [Bacillus sp. S/N-304-OC-R1]|uniref:spore germination protein n=1 Tax=Bacillus sp. S/N-304-OC-R1 TaxID=2758034 RepID=UPI001C8D9938|nr:spore germination protein [Bacillus sp. S/N-304-OC-R1]MBY0120433.1 spore germination protein [Bacillus sp. S/N-304-OC-R1]
MTYQTKNLINQVKNIFLESSDFTNKTLLSNEIKLELLYFSSLASSDKLIENIVPYLTKLEDSQFQDYLYNITTRHTKELDEVIESLLKGYIALAVEDADVLFLIYLSDPIKRSIDEPKSELIVRGSHAGFVEHLSTNIQIIRNFIIDRNLVVHIIQLGTKTKTSTAIIYREDLVNSAILAEVKRRLSYINIETDILITPGFIEEFIEDDPFSVFPQILYTERPDRVGENIMDGRIAIMTEGSPAALIVPVNFFSFYQSPDDYNSRWTTASFIRILRMVSLIIAITFPSIYIGIVSFHLEVLPNKLIIPMKNAVENIPYPPIIEAIVMEVTIELIREAGIRLPTPISQTIGIVGGLVIGDAVVKAGLVSNVMIVVVAITAISSFVVPSNELSAAVRMLRFPLMLIAATFGFIGLVFGFIVILIKLCKQESFGVPYFYPLAPFRINGLKDSVIRLPLWLMKERPQDTMAKRKKKMKLIRGWDNHDQ